MHLGSLYTAAAGYLDARAHGGRWLLRMEDLDQPRVIAGSADDILRTLEAFGFEWDGAVVYQQDRLASYAAAMLELSGQTFECSCSRARLLDERYAGRCREGPVHAGVPTATRLRVEAGTIRVHDGVQGDFRQDVAAVAGDPVLKRRDGLFAYLMAVVVDDAAQKVTHIVRGADLLDQTPRQIYLQERLKLPRPLYAHVPVLLEPGGGKLSKSARNLQLDTRTPAAQLVAVFDLLGLAPAAGLALTTPTTLWKWAIERWHMTRVPRRLALSLPA